MSKKARIGYFTWRIHFQHLDGDAHGSTDTNSKQIFVDSQQTKENQQDTLLHELFHACSLDCPSFKLDYNSADEREEDIIRFVSPRLNQTIRDNKWIKEFLWD